MGKKEKQFYLWWRDRVSLSEKLRIMSIESSVVIKMMQTVDIFLIDPGKNLPEKFNTFH